MKKRCLSLCLSLLTTLSVLTAQSLPTLPASDEAAILDLMHQQEVAWNTGDIDQFMAAYWENDSLIFMGSSGVTYGYEATRANYYRGYPDRRAMGQLSFEILHLSHLAEGAALMVGKWQLQRQDGDRGGYFSLTWREFDEGWRIVADHTSLSAEARTDN